MANAVAAGWAFSFVNRVDGCIHLSVHLPNFGDADGEGARVRILNGTRSAVAPATIASRDGEMYLEATLPRSQYRNGLWELAISPSTGERFVNVGARICICDPNPISLLVIPQSTSFVPKPHHTLARRQRVAGSLGRVADRVLIELPPAQATKARAALRKAARRIVPS